MLTEFLYKPFTRAAIFYLCIVIACIAFGLLFKPVLIPIALSFLLYIVLEPQVNRLVRRGMHELAAIILVLFTTVAGIAALFVLMFPLLLDQVADIQLRMPFIWKNIETLLGQANNITRTSLGLEINPQTVLANATAYTKHWSSALIFSSAGLVAQISMTLVLVPLVTFFLLRDYIGIRNRMMSWLPNRGFELGWLMYHKVGKQLQGYLRGIMIESSIIAAITSIGFLIAGIDMAILFGCLTGLLNLIPYVGPLIALIPPTIVALGAENYTTYSLLAIPVVILTAQLIDNILVIPAVIATTVDLHPLIVLFGIVIFGALFGFVGMLIAIPVISASKIVFFTLLYGLQGSQSQI